MDWKKITGKEGDDQTGVEWGLRCRSLAQIIMFYRRFFSHSQDLINRLIKWEYCAVSEGAVIWKEVMEHPDKETATYHVPCKIGQPVYSGVDAADELQVLGFAHPLLDEEEDKAGGDEGHGEDNADGHHHICGRPDPVIERSTEMT